MKSLVAAWKQHFTRIFHAYEMTVHKQNGKYEYIFSWNDGMAMIINLPNWNKNEEPVNITASIILWPAWHYRERSAAILTGEAGNE
ncbi:hypothetical protein [Massilia rubra]|uniref:Uncharacterized protein n=1 Tax=Massilia rubra TaxID=2607910 RepID=A0ABX0LJG2_9BURK|nr:hypothetical protein [Massilia rubra]NHZ34784.1 hypothetical protein [Massilia rubra]